MFVSPYLQLLQSRSYHECNEYKRIVERKMLVQYVVLVA
jgi:hypothetical protein